MKIYIIRHGETEANRRGLLQGWSDYDINDAGIELAEITGMNMSDIKFDVAFTSPLIRARHTAELVLESSGNGNIPIEIDDRLKEIHMGEWELKKFRPGESEVDENLVATFLSGPQHSFGCEGGETIAELCERTQSFLQEIAKKDYQNVLVSTHGCALRAMLNFLYEDPTDFWHGHVPYNCVVNIVEVEDGQMKLIGDDVLYYGCEHCVDHYDLNR